MGQKAEDKLIRLSETVEMFMKKDLLEVSELIVKGIEQYEVLGYAAIALGAFFAWTSQYLADPAWISPEFGFALGIFLAVALFAGGLFLLYTKHKLKQKYEELIASVKLVKRE